MQIEEVFYVIKYDNLIFCVSSQVKEKFSIFKDLEG